MSHPTRLTPPRRGPHAARPLLAAAALAALAGCSAENDKFAPACPQRVAITPEMGDLHRFRGQGRDITDSVLEGRILGYGDGGCKRDGAGTVVVTLSLNMQLIRGPAATSRTADVSYWVAVTEGGEGRIVDKQIYNLRAEFPANTDRLRLAGDEIELRLPVSQQKSAAAYTVAVGFQLTPAELAENRNQPRRR